MSETSIDYVPPSNEVSSVPAPVSQENRGGRSIKYLGMSDVRRLEAGEQLLGTQEVGLPVTVEWTAENSHLLHTADYPEVPDSFWDQVCSYETFEDVTGKKPEEIPQSDYDQVYRPQG